MTDLPTPTPPVNPETETFWEATTDDMLLVPKCMSCGEFFFYPRAQCPECRSDSLDWVEADGTGEIYSYTIVRAGVGQPYADATPYVLAYVELSEGPRMMTHIVDVDPDQEADELAVGREVELAFHETDDEEDDYALPRFRLAE